MAIKYYAPGDHEKNFVGFFVKVRVDGEQRSSYFSTATASRQHETDIVFLYQWVSAMRLDLEWRIERRESHYRRFVSGNHTLTRPYRGTGVHGLVLGFRRTGERWDACFIVSKDGRGNPPTLFRFTDQTFSEAWRAAVTRWADRHDIADSDRDRVLADQPEPLQFSELRRHMNEEEGYDIPVEALSDVFWEQRERLKRTRWLRDPQAPTPAGGPAYDPEAALAEQLATA